MNFKLSLLNTLDCETRKEEEAAVLFRLSGKNCAIIDVHNRGLYIHTSVGTDIFRPIVMGVDLL